MENTKKTPPVKRMFQYKKTPDSANSLILKPTAFAIVAIVTGFFCLYLLPWMCFRAEKLETPSRFRLAYRFRDDYLTWRRAAAQTAEKHRVLFIGDSVIWGMFADNNSTLPALANAGNLAIDGLHPVAMAGLLRHYRPGNLTGRRIYLYWNPLWLNTPASDLTAAGKGSVNHPRLLPQLDCNLKAYSGSFSDRCNAVFERLSPLPGLLHHWRVKCFANQDFKAVIAANPASFPVSALLSPCRPAETETGNGTKTWKQGGITKQDWQWVGIAESRQWQAFIGVVSLLRENGNEVCVLAGRVNPYLQTDASLARYRAMRQNALNDLQARQIEYLDLPELASEQYADASHPLAAGYQVWNTFINSNGRFQGARDNR